MPAPDAALDRFLAHHAVAPQVAAAADAAPYRGMPQVEHAGHLAALCRLAADQLRARPDAARVLAWREPPHPDWLRLTRRTRT
jgi:hypothetical protein